MLLCFVDVKWEKNKCKIAVASVYLFISVFLQIKSALIKVGQKHFQRSLALNYFLNSEISYVYPPDTAVSTFKVDGG